MKPNNTPAQKEQKHVKWQKKKLVSWVLTCSKKVSIEIASSDHWKIHFMRCHCQTENTAMLKVKKTTIIQWNNRSSKRFCMFSIIASESPTTMFMLSKTGRILFIKGLQAEYWTEFWLGQWLWGCEDSTSPASEQCHVNLVLFLCNAIWTKAQGPWNSVVLWLCLVS